MASASNRSQSEVPRQLTACDSDEGISDASYLPTFDSPPMMVANTAGKTDKASEHRLYAGYPPTSSSKFMAADDHTAGVAEALLKLQNKLSLLSHERALAEKDLNALSTELSCARSHGYGRTAEYRHRSRPTAANDHAESVACARNEACRVAAERRDIPAKVYLTSKAGSHDCKPEADSEVDEDADDESHPIGGARVDLSAAEARCHRLDARLALMRRTLHDAATVCGACSGVTSEHGIGRASCCCEQVNKDVCHQRRQANAGGGAPRAAAKTTGGSRAASVPRTLSADYHKRSKPRCAQVSRPAAGTLLLQSNSLYDASRGARARTCSLSGAAQNSQAGIPFTVNAAGCAGSASMLKQSRVAGGQRGARARGAPAALPTGQQRVRGASQTQHDNHVMDRVALVATLRQLRADFSRLTKEHRELTLIIGEALSTGRPSVDLERELEHLVEKMEVKGDEIASCVRLLTITPSANGSSAGEYHVAIPSSSNVGAAARSQPRLATSCGSSRTKSHKRGRASCKQSSAIHGRPRVRCSPKAKVIIPSAGRKCSSSVISRRNYLATPFGVAWS